ncbi:hypothetical protein NSTC745_06390 [Nostoc sp. DSM 114161]|jgi:hypothetical protein|uniref:hypothetical protein n=1 Tax=Nostoc sp. DSM 114161 TaxID=3440143 RepID=UPI0040465D35
MEADSGSVSDFGASEMLRARSLLNRNLYQQKISDAAEELSELPLPTTYQSFDAQQGLARLKDITSNISYGAAQTNGAVGKSENIRLRRGGILARYDAMPRRKSQVAAISESTQELEAVFLFYVKAWSEFADTGASFRNAVFFESIQNTGYTNFTHSKNQQIQSDRVTYENSLTANFRHTGANNYLVFGNVSSNSGQIFTNGTYPIKFFSPTEAKITININFSPGGGVVNTSCGISVDRQVSFLRNEIQSTVAIIPSSCDAYSSGTSASYEVMVAAGEHFVTCLGCYSYSYSIKGNSPDDFIYSENFSGNISITVETITGSTFYLQKGNRVTRLEGIITESINNTTGSLVGYLTFTKTRILAHIKYRHPTIATNEFVDRYLLTGAQLSHQRFTSPEEIPVLEDDWQREWTSTYLPDADAEDPCINSLKNNNKRRFTNIFKKQMIALDINQVVNNQNLQNLIKVRDIVAKVEFSSYRSEGTCTIEAKTTKNIKLKKLIIPENIDASAVTILGVSVITK